jgi:hypothetical protein
MRCCRLLREIVFAVVYAPTTASSVKEGAVCAAHAVLWEGGSAR